MAKKKMGGLGKGLDSLFADLSDDTGSEASNSTLPLREIEPDPEQPRKRFDDDALNQLADSITENGLLQPIAVRPKKVGPGYIIIAGERRWRAARLAGLDEVPVIIKDVTDEQAAALALIENYFGRPLSTDERTARSQIYAAALKDIPDDVAAAALTKALTVCRYQNQLLVDWCAEIRKLQSAGQPTANDLWTQAIVAAQLDDHQLRLMLRKQRRQPRGAARAGIATDRSIDYTMLETAVLQAFLQQCDPTLAGIHPQSGADTIPDHQDGAGQCALCPHQQCQCTAHPQRTHRILHERKHS